MYCRKCGRALEEGDAFCTNCGTPVPEDELVSRRMNAATQNPEFKWDVREEFPEPRKRETMVFNWSDGTMTPVRPTAPVEQPSAPTQPREPSYYPPAEPTAPVEPSYRVTEQPSATTGRETRVFATPVEPTRDPYKATSEPTIAYSVREPEEPTVAFRPTAPVEPSYHTPTEPSFSPCNTTEREIFRDVQQADEEAYRRRDDRFYTFTKKNEEFQLLLDREYERVRRNGTPVERPLRTEPPLFGYDPDVRRDAMPSAAYERETPSFATEPARPASVPTPASVAPSTPEPARPYEPAEPTRPTPVSPSASASDTISFSAVKSEPAPVAPTPTPAPQPAPAPVKARPEPTYRTDPDEIRTIWEEIKADMERENAARIAKAAEAERVAKMSAEAERTENAGRRVGAVNRKDLLTPAETEARREAAGHTGRDTGEVAAVTATALTRIWEDDPDGENEKEPKKKGRFWLWFFLIILLALLAILAVFVVQTFWPDTRAAEIAADCEVWLKAAWANIKDFFELLFRK